MSESLLANNAVSEVPDAARHRSLISRHRRIFKEVGAVTGITFVDHPKGKEAGVVVSALTPDGACAKAGVCVGDHITKINGTRPTDQKHAVALCDAAWTAEADGTDKNKDRLKFSLHFRTQSFAISKPGLSAGAVVGVEVMAGSAKKNLLGGGKKHEDTGLELQDSPNGYGALIVSVAPDSAAHVGGLEAGLTVISVDGKLCAGGAKDVTKMIDAARSKKSAASLVCHLPKGAKDDEAEHI